MVAPFSMMSRRDLEGIVKGRVSAMMRRVYDMPSRGQRIPGNRRDALVLVVLNIQQIFYMLFISTVLSGKGFLLAEWYCWWPPVMPKV